MNKFGDSEFDEWPDAVLLVDSEDQVVRANRPALNAFGYSPTEISGIPLRQLASTESDHRKAWARALYTIPSEPDFSPGTKLSCIRSDGSKFDAYMTLAIAPRMGENWRWLQFVLDEQAQWPEAVAGDEVASSSEENGISHALGSLLASLVSFDRIFEETAERLDKVLDYNHFAVGLFDHVAETIRIVRSAYRNYDYPIRSTDDSYPMRGTISEQMLDTRSPQLVLNDTVEQHIREYPGSMPYPGRFLSELTPAFLSTIMVPVYRGELIQGMALLQSIRVNAYGNTELKVVSDLASSV